MNIQAQERLDYLATLEDGWMGAGYAKAIDKYVLQQAREFFDMLGNQLSEIKLGIFPSEDGDIVVEWFLPHETWAIDFEKEDTYVAIYDHTVDIDSPEHTKELETKNPQNIVNFLLNHYTAG